ncbi:1-phosphatidylinositol 4,5-bisphosphate phosphodiesterase beta-1-like [Xyrauchen texanus]|uniref:1-phosphatidylinositol 4,5-bisphosphate phosphodiesterase beta-1-like n=1 Tax=Xyrauchen texanus TaxID=154827 RepID=UPI0022422B4D|nr:1-phosphatidylinositol 4,5-bisphosphate phosphodiesterase beta-1-like [Xyrauchen texanus]
MDRCASSEEWDLNTLAITYPDNTQTDNEQPATENSQETSDSTVSPPQTPHHTPKHPQKPQALKLQPPKTKLQNDLKREYQDKFRRLPLEIQEVLQDSAACQQKFSNDGHWNDLPNPTMTEELNHTAASPDVNIHERSSEKGFDTSL